MGTALNILFRPAVLYTLLCALFFAGLALRKMLARAQIALPVLIGAAGILALSFLNPQFARQAGKPDNLALWATLFFIAFFLWIGFRQAAENDARLEQGQRVAEAEISRQRVFVWPNLLYMEAIAAAFALVVLFAWSMSIDAPLEQIADPSTSPNPSKAPWYFLGLQELLVYFDPWIAGVLLPCMAVTGLLALPYCDPNPKGSGYYGFRQRPFAITVYLFGFLLLWIVLICFGAALRGPNWSFYGPYEAWDASKALAFANINLDQIVWHHDLSSMHWFLRELPGLALVAAYFTLLPALGRKLFRETYEELGFVRYSIVAIHLLVMLAVPIKMYLHWCFGLKYVVYIPEFFFNI
ncbi:MAG TPA: cytochrome C [Planctomycetota bacterium]|jgi:hypothetical protein